MRLFREHGWDVVGVARRADRLDTLARETGAAVFVADLTVQADVDALREYLAGSGPVNALVNNAGGAKGSTPWSPGRSRTGPGCSRSTCSP